MLFKFTKMHGLGNDFIVIDGIRQQIALTSAMIQKLSRRDTGIGFDQCLVITSPTKPHLDFTYLIYNANGESVGQCGNGARCIAKFIEYYKLSDKKQLSVGTKTTEMTLIINPDQTITVEMGQPNFNPTRIPLRMETQHDRYQITLDTGKIIPFHALSIGNPHAIIDCDNINTCDFENIAPKIQQSPLFPESVNVGFMHRLSPEHIRLRVYERGAGETKACGSGAVAAAIVARTFYQGAAEMRISLPGGDLTVQWPDAQSSVYLTGPAEFVYEGVVF